VVESTYGDRLHPPRGLDSLAVKIREVFDRGGLVLAPAFAIDRTAVLLMALRSLTRAGKLPTVPVFVDSPMALAALEVYAEAVREHGEEIRDDVKVHGADPFDPGDLRIARTVEESMRLDHTSGPCIIISAAGMATGGRVVHHLAKLAPNPRNLILLPGFQVPGTRGRSLQEGATALRCSVVTCRFGPRCLPWRDSPRTRTPTASSRGFAPHRNHRAPATSCTARRTPRLRSNAASPRSSAGVPLFPDTPSGSWSEPRCPRGADSRADPRTGSSHARPTPTYGLTLQARPHRGIPVAVALTGLSFFAAHR
jgi:hypothetical protein